MRLGETIKLRRGGAEQRGRGKKILKGGGQAGSKGGCLKKRGTGTPL